jgi:hypothetical protein
LWQDRGFGFIRPDADDGAAALGSIFCHRKAIEDGDFLEVFPSVLPSVLPSLLPSLLPSFLLR